MLTGITAGTSARRRSSGVTSGTPIVSSAPKVTSTPSTSAELIRSSVFGEDTAREPPARRVNRGAPAAAGRVNCGRSSRRREPPWSM